MVVKAHQVYFNLYGYNILPLTRAVPLFFEDQRIRSIDDLMRFTNELLADALRTKTKTFDYGKTDIRDQIELDSDGFIILRLAARRPLTISKEDFTTGKIANWPNMIIAIDNNPNVQKIAIQVNRKVFASTNTVKGILEDNLNAILKRNHLRAYIEPKFDQKEFWSFVNQYRTKILQADFEMVSPNMANISGELNFNLGELAKTTNTNITHLQLNSEKNGSLVLSEDNSFIKSIVDYISNAAAGDITVKTRGIRAKIHMTTENTRFSITADELSLQGTLPESIKQEILNKMK